MGVLAHMGAQVCGAAAHLHDQLIEFWCSEMVGVVSIVGIVGIVSIVSIVSIVGIGSIGSIVSVPSS